ncbi:MAG: RagB/SusD family nutrient uptake outer membrane protein, partial [Phaeodactylibacter sp.]|nr:RagB/SusD family nutrient uptake outer membrane protein [Phaeodactylibacter sp.]
MKKLLIKFLFVLPLLVPVACSDNLNVVNPNEPTLGVLDSEEGFLRLMLGTYDAFDGVTCNFPWIVSAHHECMGDAIYIPWGNFSWRWANQPTKIILDDGTVVTPPEGGSQAQELILRNDRAQGDNNAFWLEWASMYRLNNHANLVLAKLDEGNIEFTGDAATKQSVSRAWAHFWKGWAYSRIGSLYAAGIINNEFSATNPDFVSNQEVIAEANSQLDQAISILQGVSESTDYTTLVERSIPDFMRPNDVPSPQSWIRIMNTLKARNLLVNKKVRDMTNADWEAVLSLAENGLTPDDNILALRTADENALFRTCFTPYRVMIGWHFASERLIQDFKEGDNRFGRNFAELASPDVNQRGRGIQYGGRYEFIAIENGGDYGTTISGLASLPIGGSWEEAYLMRAEALIKTGKIDDGLALIDEVRTAQDAGLDPVTGTGLNEEQAYEELRRERRIGLFLRGLPFYDARRWGLTDPLEEGGGRTGCVVLDAAGNLNTNATFDYNYLDYWGVP